MKFKNPKLKEEVWKLTPKAQYLLCFTNWISIVLFNKPIMVTCIWYNGGSGVHALWRAFDIRTENYYSKKDIAKFIGFVNEHFPYDKKRPKMKSAIYHKVNKKKIKDYKLKDFKPQYHLHAQVWIR